MRIRKRELQAEGTAGRKALRWEGVSEQQKEASMAGAQEAETEGVKGRRERHRARPLSP